MANSKLATWKWNGSTDHYNTREHKIDTITIHHMAGNLSLSGCCNSVQSRGGSCNYCIDTLGNIGVMIDEQYRAWTSSNRANDMRAVTIEVANDSGDPTWHVSDEAMSSLIALCADICRRNDIKKLNYTGDTSGNMTMHKWFEATACPGPYLSSKFDYIAERVNKKLLGDSMSSAAPSAEDTSYRVRITYPEGMNVRTGPGINNPVAKINNLAKYNTVYTIVAEKNVDGQTWGKLKSGAGWICLTGFTKRV